MIYTQTTIGCFEESVGTEGAGKDEYAEAFSAAKKAVEKFSGYYAGKLWPVLSIAERTDDLDIIEEVSSRIKADFDTVVVLGMGASSHGGSALVALARNHFTGLADGTTIHFIDNIDPFTFEQFLSSINLRSTMFLAISKSGSTAETMAQLLVLLNEVEIQLGRAAQKNNFVFITEPGDNPMRRLANAHGIFSIDHAPDIGGRFAALTAVGLLPAKIAGLDIRAIRRGALSVIKHVFSAQSPEPAIGAALHQALLKKGKTVSIMMPYCDRLDAFSAWHQQLWAESLGKNGRGTTALRALGAFDQHSQLQLYLDGPRDKFVTMILLEQEASGHVIPLTTEKSLSYLNGHTIGDLMSAEQIATAETLTSNHCPLRIFALKKLDEESIGALMMHFMIETMIMAQIWGIDAFDQPAVEQGKKRAREMLAQDHSNSN